MGPSRRLPTTHLATKPQRQMKREIPLYAHARRLQTGADGHEPAQPDHPPMIILPPAAPLPTRTPPTPCAGAPVRPALRPPTRTTIISGWPPRLRRRVRRFSPRRHFGIDNNGNQTSVTDPRSNTTATTYDTRNRKKTVTNPLSQTTTWNYDAGQQCEPALIVPDGTTETKTYDTMHRVLTDTVPQTKHGQPDHHICLQSIWNAPESDRSQRSSHHLCLRRCGSENQDDLSQRRLSGVDL